ncbi:MAG TPA: alpha/beta hydrolase [Nitrospirota bacterium]|nr:alpha/beta hydrolase [Nitrospirota bacterium]
MKTYLLLHGALRGAWLWDRLTPLLEKTGAKVLAIDFPGHGKRAAQREGVDMSAYIRDVESFIRENDLRDLILVGHSVSGIIISKAAEDMPERVRHLVYLAAVVPRDGEAVIDLLSKERQEVLRKLEGEKDLFGPPDTLRPLFFTDMEGKEQDFYLRQLTPQPLAAFFEKIRFKRFPDIDIPKTFILGLRDKSIPPELTRGYAARLGVKPVEIDAGHDLMVSKPEEVAQVLSRID